MKYTLCETFEWLGKAAWNDIREAGASGLSFSEETITERNLLHLVRYYGDRVRIVAFDKHREGLNGADWEWWIGRPGAWDGMRVQAKRINYPKRDNFPGLQTKKAARTTNKRQIDLLIETSRTENLTPVYCFYVHTDGSLLISGEHGCFIGHASTIKRIGEISLGGLLPAIAPWHCLVCGPDGGSVSGGTPTKRALQAVVERVVFLGEESESDLVARTREALPGYVAMLQVPKAQLGVTQLDRLKAASRALERNIKGIVLIDIGGEG